jgi:hypothetical protein
MASTINAITTGTGGIVATGDTSGALALQTNNGTTAMTIDASQNVGIGTASPSYKLETSGSAAATYVSSATTNLNATGFIANQMISGSAGANGIAGLYYRPQSYLAIGTVANDAVSYLSMQTNGTERMRIDSSGNVLVGTTTSSGKTTILQSTNASALSIGNENTIDGGYYGVVQITRPGDQTGNAFHLAFVRNGNKIAGMGFLDNSNTFAIQNANDNTGAGVTLTSGATSWGTTSDERKKDIVGNIENALSKISDWRCVYYKYKSDEQNTQQRVGLVAQDVQKTLPEAISIEEDELQTLQLRYTETIPVLVKAIQEQQTIINDLTARIEKLEAK